MQDDPKMTQEAPKQDAVQTADRSAQERFTQIKAQRILSKTVGELADFIPFAWRNPIDLSGQKRVGKVLRGIAASESARRELVPAEKKFDE